MEDNNYLGKMNWKVLVGAYENSETFLDFIYRNNFQNDEYMKDVIANRGNYTFIRINPDLISNFEIAHSLVNSEVLVFLVLKNEDHEILKEKPELLKVILLNWIAECKEKIKRNILNFYKFEMDKRTVLKEILFLDSQA